MTKTTIYLPEEMHEQLRQLARSTRGSVGDLIAIAIADALLAQSALGLNELQKRVRQRRFAKDRRFRWNRARS